MPFHTPSLSGLSIPPSGCKAHSLQTDNRSGPERVPSPAPHPAEEPDDGPITDGERNPIHRPDRAERLHRVTKTRISCMRGSSERETARSVGRSLANVSYGFGIAGKSSLLPRWSKCLT